MPSVAFNMWFTERAATLDDVENAHRAVRGSGQGARAAALQINQAYAVLLSAQFQGYCRDLHMECTDQLVAPVADPALKIALRANLLFGRRLDRGNPNAGNVGADFNRFNVVFWPVVDGHHPDNPARRVALEDLNEWRNAIAHQDFNAALLRAGRPHLTLARVREWRKACDGLVKSFDEVLRDHVRTLTGRAPW
jgi:hypothetical protein